MCLPGLGLYQAVLQFISYTKYVESDILKLRKMCNHRLSQHLLKHKHIFLKRRKNIYYFKGWAKDLHVIKKFDGGLYI